MSRKTLSQAIAEKLRSCRADYDSIPFHNKPAIISDCPAPDGVPTLDSLLARIPTPDSILLQPDVPVRLNKPTDPKAMFAGALDPDTLAHSRYTIHHK